MSKPLPTPAMLRKLLRYKADTGKLFWRTRISDMFRADIQTASHNCARWNTKFSGKEALTSYTAGYLTGVIFNVRHRAHRVIWAMERGSWPSEEIDHINGIRDDNRINNLRAVSRKENCKNIGYRRNNTSGVMGVMWHKKGQKWCAQIAINGHKKHLGMFATIQDATMARCIAETKYGFHVNHGRMTKNEEVNHG